MAALPDATRASTVVCRSAAVRATHTTFASASASAVAYARPNPRDAPVTIVVCPRSFSRAYSDGILIDWDVRRRQRSEEHTSELQSRRDLVCRLLLEKKKNYNA